MSRPGTTPIPTLPLSSAKLKTPRQGGDVEAKVIQRSFSCRPRPNEEANLSKQDNSHWSKIRDMTKDRFFTKQTTVNVSKNVKDAENSKKGKGQSFSGENRRNQTSSRSPSNIKDSTHWSKVRKMTQAGFFSTAKIISHPPPDKMDSARCGVSQLKNESGLMDNKLLDSPPVSSRQHKNYSDKLNRTKYENGKDKGWKQQCRSEMIVDKSLKGILKQKYVQKKSQTTNVKYIDISSGKQIVFGDLVRYRRNSSASDSSRSTFNNEEGRPVTSYVIGQESKFINTVNIIQNFDVPKKELQTLNMKKMTPFKYVYVLSKCLPQIICKNYRPASIPVDNDPLYNQRLLENRPSSSRPSTPASSSEGISTSPESLPEINLS